MRGVNRFVPGTLSFRHLMLFLFFFCLCFLCCSLFHISLLHDCMGVRKRWGRGNPCYFYFLPSSLPAPPNKTVERKFTQTHIHIHVHMHICIITLFISFPFYFSLTLFFSFFACIRLLIYSIVCLPLSLCLFFHFYVLWCPSFFPTVRSVCCCCCFPFLFHLIIPGPLLPLLISFFFCPQPHATIVCNELKNKRNGMKTGEKTFEKKGEGEKREEKIR